MIILSVFAVITGLCVYAAIVGVTAGYLIGRLDMDDDDPTVWMLAAFWPLTVAGIVPYLLGRAFTTWARQRFNNGR